MDISRADCYLAAIFKEVAAVREIITMECTECKNRNYTTKKNTKNDRDRLELKKHCPTCQSHTVHKETK